MGRISRLDNPTFAKLVADLYISGVSRPEMAAELGCHVDTITDWTKDARVQAHASRAAQERVHRIGRKIDAVIEGRLIEGADDMDTETLLKIRKEYLDRPLKIMLGEADKNPDTIVDAMSVLEDNPDLMRALFASMNGEKLELPQTVEGTAEDLDT